METLRSAQKLKSAERFLSEDHDELQGLLEAVFEALDDTNPARTFERLDLFWARLGMHIRAEHLHLFPLVIQEVGTRVGLEQSLSLGEVIAAVRTLRNDHNHFMTELARAVKLAREATSTSERKEIERCHSEVRQILTALTERLETHNQLEEEIVYRLPKRVMTAPRQAMLAANIGKELTNLPKRFGGPTEFEVVPEG